MDKATLEFPMAMQALRSIDQLRIIDTYQK
jgi:hypothetical protein